jgi:EAL domain-containing protein (putative c-di-GMP-specific phosphodiesterase class I)
MYAAKRGGTTQVFARELDHHSPVRLAMTGELRLALDRRELVVHYQPQFDLRAGHVRSVEALVRWRHPTRGLLEPRAFLDAVEHAGLTRRLTRYVLDESLRDLRAWHDAGLDFGLAVNVSARDLADARFPEEIAQALADHDIDPSLLELEITEDMLLLDTVRARKRLETIAEQGVRIAIDDFGVGYSSLGQLKHLPARVLKVDQSFVSGMGSDRRDAAIVRSTIGLAHDLGLEVVAEGVETPDHILQLRAAGCDMGQGYYLGRPLAVAAHTNATFTSASDVVPVDPGAKIVPLRRVAG